MLYVVYVTRFVYRIHIILYIHIYARIELVSLGHVSEETIFGICSTLKLHTNNETLVFDSIILVILNPFGSANNWQMLAPDISESCT